MIGFVNQLTDKILQVAMAPGGEGGNSLISMLVLMAVLIGIWYFLIIGPERKRRAKLQELISSLKTGDKVITVGGIHGTVAGATDKTVILRVSDQVKIEFSRQAIGTVIQPEAELTPEKKQ
jgi:preprotein translocase subunit YajC